MHPRYLCPETCLLRRIYTGGKLQWNLTIKCDDPAERCFCIAMLYKERHFLTDEAHAQQVARVTNLSTRSLRSYARRGLLRPVYYGGSSRAWGYHADSVRAFIENAKR